MKKLEDSFHEKLEKQKQAHEKPIQQLKEEISQCPPVIVTMVNCNPYDSSKSLSVFDLFHNEVFMSSTFYSHPQGYKLCIVLKCVGTTAIMGLKVASCTIQTSAFIFVAMQRSGRHHNTSWKSESCAFQDWH